MSAEPTLTGAEVYVLVAAVRYQLPRETYGSAAIADHLRAVWSRIAAPDQRLILREIRAAIAAGRAGDPGIDVPEWRRVLALDTSSQQSPAPAPETCDAG